MADNMDKEYSVEEEELGTISLIDEETGEEIEFELLAYCNIDDVDYCAVAPVGEDTDEYTILKYSVDGENTTFETIDDDDEFEKVAEQFDDMFFSDINYDA